MAHYVFQCIPYPEFSINVPGMDRNAKEESKVVHFHRGHLDTKLAELTEEEAEATLEQLKRCRQRPGWGTDIKILTRVEGKEKDRA